MTDARLQFSLPSHPKTQKLIRRLNPHGEVGAWFLVRMILWTCQVRPSGDLSRMTDEDLEIAVHWTGQAGTLVAAMAEVGFLDGAEGERRWHDWCVHQPWAAGAKSRRDQATWNGLMRKGLEYAKMKRPDLFARISAEANTKNGKRNEANRFKIGSGPLQNDQNGLFDNATESQQEAVRFTFGSGMKQTAAFLPAPSPSLNKSTPQPPRGDASPQALSPDEPLPLKALPPSKEKKKTGERARNLILDALMAAAGHDIQHTTSAEWKRGAAALAQIRSADPDVTPAQLAAAARAYRQEWPAMTLTVTALASHWSRFRASSPPPEGGHSGGGGGRYGSPFCAFWQDWCNSHLGWQLDLDADWLTLPINRRKEAIDAYDRDQDQLPT